MFIDDEFDEEYDEFDGDEEFREVILGERTQTETRDVVAVLDHEWFAEHPEYKRRIRRYVPGEFDNEAGGVFGDPGDAYVVLVRRDGIKILFPLGAFDRRGWLAGGLQ